MATPATEKTARESAEAPRRASVLRRLMYGLAALLVAVVAYLLLWPAPIDPVGYEPPPKLPLEGPLAPNQILQSAELIAVGQVAGPEDVEVDASGNIFTGTLDGRIVRVDPKGQVTTIANTGGRPAGLATAPGGELIVADAAKGLLSITKSGQITALSTDVDGKPAHFPDDLDVARDGTVYFSDASDKFGINTFLYDMLEGRPHGRLLRYDPATKRTTVLLSGLYFANGVALSQHEDFVLVNETYRHRITRYWLKGAKAGTSDVFIDNLPGYPDNITSNRRGTFWLALFTVRNDAGDWLAPRPFVKRLFSKLPGFLWPKPQPYGFVVQLDENGRILQSFQDPSGRHLEAITSAFERDGFLYLGSLSNRQIGKLKLPELRK